VAQKSIGADRLDGRGDELALRHCREHVLPRVRGVPLAFTDGTALPDGRWLFTAVAEATDDAVADGACVGSAVGLMSGDHALLSLRRLPGNDKVEGITARAREACIDLALVTDADDPRVPSRLLVGRFAY
jgi:hypothetical protein